MERFELTHDGKRLAFMTNEEGMSVLHVMETATQKEMRLPKLPAGVIGSTAIGTANGQDLGFALTNAQEPGRLLLGGRRDRESGAMDGERERGEDRCVSGSGAGALEEF